MSRRFILTENRIIDGQPGFAVLFFPSIGLWYGFLLAYPLEKVL
jgi:hypothetical protein